MKSIILKITDSPIVYARFLNTLSLLEYIGARKILKSQPQENINEKILAHAAEELRHARVLKKAAQKLAPDLCYSYLPNELLCGTDAVNYFQGVDYAVQNQLGNLYSIDAYIYTTILIEKRALAFYNLFENTLIELGKPSVFRGIIVEENRHLHEMINCLINEKPFEQDMKILRSLEQKEFNHFMNIIDDAI